jgi:hypothetical protein
MPWGLPPTPSQHHLDGGGPRNVGHQPQRGHDPPLDLGLKLHHQGALLARGDAQRGLARDGEAAFQALERRDLEIAVAGVGEDEVLLDALVDGGRAQLEHQRRRTQHALAHGALVDRGRVGAHIAHVHVDHRPIGGGGRVAVAAAVIAGGTPEKGQ